MGQLTDIITDPYKAREYQHLCSYGSISVGSQLDMVLIGCIWARETAELGQTLNQDGESVPCGAQMTNCKSNNNFHYHTILQAQHPCHHHLH